MQSESKLLVTAVSTPEELLDAVQDGAEHIEVRAHLDLSALEPPQQSSVQSDSRDAPDILLGVLPPSVKSIRV